MKDVWKDVEDWEGYQVSPTSKVRKKSNGRLAPLSWLGQIGNEMLHVHLIRGTRTWAVPLHVIVIRAFHGDRPAGLHIAHLDGNRAHNSLSNLAYVTPAENEAHKYEHGTVLLGEANPRAKLNADKVRQIRQRHRDDATFNVAAAAAEFGVNRDTIYGVINRETWLHVDEDQQGPGGANNLARR